jgi:hypothetical protein
MVGGGLVETEVLLARWQGEKPVKELVMVGGSGGDRAFSLVVVWCPKPDIRCSAHRSPFPALECI